MSAATESAAPVPVVTPAPSQEDAVAQAAADHESAVNRYACAMVKRDRLHAHDGLPEDDRTTDGRALKAGA